MTLRQAQERSLGHIKNLEKGFQKKVAEWFQECWAKKLYVLIYCSSRTQEEQEELYKKWWYRDWETKNQNIKQIGRAHV